MKNILEKALEAHESAKTAIEFEGNDSMGPFETAFINNIKELDLKLTQAELSKNVARINRAVKELMGALEI